MRDLRLLNRGLVGILVLSIAVVSTSHSQEHVPQESIVMSELPDPLVCQNGDKVTDIDDWEKVRRHELLNLLSRHVYGRFPKGKVQVEFKTTQSFPIFESTWECREVDMRFRNSKGELTAKLLLFMPDSLDPVGCFVGLNFNGNHTTFGDERISIPTAWVRNREDFEISDNRASEKSRGSASGRWPVEKILKRGYALATVYYGDFDPDFDDGFQNGIHPLFFEPGQTQPAADQWGSIGAWAWGLSRIMDYLETQTKIDPNRIAVLGHSRLGKTALWCGANDERFSIVISNNSGCGGAALSRRRVGETVEKINTTFPHWLCDNFTDYNGREDELPVDQHSLMAVISPRPVYVASATEDQWADPVGEYQSLVYASPVFELYGNGQVAVDQPPPNSPVIFGRIGYHLREGKHDIREYDWQQYLDFADKQFSKSSISDKLK